MAFNYIVHEAQNNVNKLLRNIIFKLCNIIMINKGVYIYMNKMADKSKYKKRIYS